MRFIIFITILLVSCNNNNSKKKNDFKNQEVKFNIYNYEK